MSPQPTGRVVRTSSGTDLILTRTFRAGIDKDAAPAQVLIDACRPPRELALSMKDAYGDWRLALSLEQSGEETTLTFVQHLTDTASVGDTGPGWEYYLDILVASRNGESLPKFDDYYPVQRDYFVTQVSKHSPPGELRRSG